MSRTAHHVPNRHRTGPARWPYGLPGPCTSHVLVELRYSRQELARAGRTGRRPAQAPERRSFAAYTYPRALNARPRGPYETTARAALQAFRTSARKRLRAARPGTLVEAAVDLDHPPTRHRHRHRHRVSRSWRSTGCCGAACRDRPRIRASSAAPPASVGPPPPGRPSPTQRPTTPPPAASQRWREPSPRPPYRRRTRCWPRGGEWVTNEKRLLERAGLRTVDDVLAAMAARADGKDPGALEQAIECAQVLFDEAVRGLRS